MFRDKVDIDSRFGIASVFIIFVNIVINVTIIITSYVLLRKFWINIIKIDVSGVFANCIKYAKLQYFFRWYWNQLTNNINLFNLYQHIF